MQGSYDSAEIETTMPSLKPPLEKKLMSGAVYQIQCQAVMPAMLVKLIDIFLSASESIQTHRNL